MNILITGASGLVGSHITETLKKNKSHTVLTPSSSELNITSAESVESYIKKHKPASVIHSAAYTDVTGGESQRDNQQGSAWRLNVDGTRHIVNTCKHHDIFLIHLSTDVVFAGRKDDQGPYVETHQMETTPERISWYGWTKVQAEHIVRNAHDRYAIVRISNPTRAQYKPKLDYVRKILAAYDAGRPITLFNDQYLTLTYINEVSESIAHIASHMKPGTFHVSSTNSFTPFELAEYLLQKTRNANHAVKKSSIEEFFKTPGNAARYPQYGGLDVRHTMHVLGIQFRSWQHIIDALIAEGLS